MSERGQSLGCLLGQALMLLGITGLQERKANKSIIKAAEKASRWLWIRGGMYGVIRCLDRSQGLSTLGWVAQVRESDDLRPETPDDPGFITD